MGPVTRTTLVVALSLLLAACAPDNGPAHKPSTSAPPTSRTATAGTRAYRDATWHFAIDVPKGWALDHDFTTSYLANGAWNTYAVPKSQGTPVVALVVPGSNHVTDAQIRIGTSKVPAEVQRCTTPPDAVHPGSLAHKAVNGIEFVTFTASDAAMSHHLAVHGYRAVHDGVCYAIDLLVYGVNPQVFDPPATAPFSSEHAFARMRRVLATFRFTH